MAVTGDVTSVLDTLAISNQQTSTKKNDELGQGAFLELMIAQLKHQDPLSPQPNGEFISQLAQFSSVEGIERLNTSVNDMATSMMSAQALQASSLVGRQVILPTSTAKLGETGSLAGIATLPASSGAVQMRVYDSAGALVAEKSLGAQAAGNVPISWDGLDSQGQRLPAGKYKVEVHALVEGESQQLDTALAANVNSVTLGQGGSMSLNVDGVGQVALSDIVQIL